MITVKNLYKIFKLEKKEQVVLNNIDLKIEDGEFISLIGKSGSGKSTLLYLLSTLDTPTKGEVYFDNKNVLSLSTKDLFQLRNSSIGFVFQSHYLLPDLTALENILMPTRKTKQNLQKTDKAMSLLEQFGLLMEKDKFPRQMSGGECQRVAIARALINDPKYIFADEPTGSLDSQNAEIVMKAFENINKTQGTSVVLVTHDPEFAKRSDRQILLVDGKIAK
jgi:putative ABC transport system ATP-binding protein/lipoprotein-releasing system ATP-binding protein